MYLPPVGFHFKLQVLDLPGATDDDVRFTEVGGLAVEYSTEEVAEGGENRFLQKYPVRPKYADLVLKRGLLRSSGIWNWVRRAIQDFAVEPKSVDVSLLDENRNALMTWHFVNAYPVKWAISDLNSTSNAFVVESLQLSYQYFTLDKN